MRVDTSTQQYRAIVDNDEIACEQNPRRCATQKFEKSYVRVRRRVATDVLCEICVIWTRPALMDFRFTGHYRLLRGRVTDRTCAEKALFCLFVFTAL